MERNHSNEQIPERTYLVGAQVRGSYELLSLEDSLDELALLADTAGLQVVGQTTQKINQIDPATFIGSGKVQEIKDDLESLNATTVIFDDELSPRHQRELAGIFGNDIKLLDRSALILDIFAQHAGTREGALQVELAQYEYRLPRLTRQWTHLARQAGGAGARGGSGGVGLRGPGETQLEVDRREISRKITKLKEELERVRSHRQRHRSQRQKMGIPVVALVGYTNAGKSTLINRLSDAGVYVADQLFATLDPTTRRVALPSGREVLFTDTVGFIQKLPTTLIAAFRATLEEVAEADILLHVVDTTHPNALAHIEAVEDTLAEIEVPDIPQILVWNKVDALGGVPVPQLEDYSDYDAQLAISAQTGENIDGLLQAVEDSINRNFIEVDLLIPYNDGRLVSHLYNNSTVEKQENRENGVLLHVQLPRQMLPQYEKYQAD